MPLWLIWSPAAGQFHLFYCVKMALVVLEMTAHVVDCDSYPLPLARESSDCSPEE